MSNKQIVRLYLKHPDTTKQLLIGTINDFSMIITKNLPVKLRKFINDRVFRDHWNHVNYSDHIDEPDKETDFSDFLKTHNFDFRAKCPCSLQDLYDFRLNVEIVYLLDCPTERPTESDAIKSQSYEVVQCAKIQPHCTKEHKDDDNM